MRLRHALLAITFLLISMPPFDGDASAQDVSRPTRGPDTMAQRMKACEICHGPEGRASNEGFNPRIAGKPAGYLFNQLVNFRDGRRHNTTMAYLVRQMSDAYLYEIAEYFAALDLPYPPPQTRGAAPATLARGERLVRDGDAARDIPACSQCHGQSMTGIEPGMPGLLGLPRDYILAQLGAWRSGQRSAVEPDCMAEIAHRLSPEDVSAMATWLSAQPVRGGVAPATALPAQLPLSCGKTPRPSRRSATTPMPAAQPAAAASADGEDASDANGRPASRGEYLARIGNCAGCHTERGGAPYAGGVGIPTPFGTVFATNLTPDEETGIGRWNADDFHRAMHEGRSRNGRLLYPAFPYPNYTTITREDNDAIFAYLRSLPAIKRPNRPHLLRFPYDVQASLAIWRTLYFTPQRFEPQTDRSVEWNRGAYLTRGLGHCQACHAPRNFIGATRSGLDLSGGLIPMQNWYAPSLEAPAEAGLQDWSATEAARLLRDGIAAKGVALGPMAEVVAGSTRHLNDADLQAMVTFLRDLPRTEPSRPEAAEDSPAMRGLGAKLYGDHCADCHGQHGEGGGSAYPALAGNRTVQMASSVNIVKTIMHGGFPPTTAANPRPYGMPPYGPFLSDTQIAAIATFVRSAWGNGAGPVTGLDVVRVR